MVALIVCVSSFITFVSVKYKVREKFSKLKFTRRRAQESAYADVRDIDLPSSSSAVVETKITQNIAYGQPSAVVDASRYP